MAWKSFFKASSTKLLSIVIIQFLITTSAYAAASGATGNALAVNNNDSAGAGKAFNEWINVEMKDFEQKEMTTDSESGGLDTELKEAERIRKIIRVSKDGSGEFGTITDALKTIPSGNKGRVIIKIGPGTYNEKILLDAKKPFVTFYGNQKSMPTIVFGGTAKKYGTFYSATVCVMSDYFMAINIIFKNSAPKPAPGSEGGQAVAMRIAGDKAAFYNCRFFGFQDTLHDDMGHHYYKNCVIQGNVDFIFGDARSLYTSCSIVSVAEPKGVTAIIAQGRTDSRDVGGFSFVRCNVTGTGSAHLSRAWRSYSRVVFAYSYLGSVVNPTGWDNHGFSKQNLYYGEYQCYGPGASLNKRVDFCAKLTDAQSKPFLDSAFINGRTWIIQPPTL